MHHAAYESRRGGVAHRVKTVDITLMTFFFQGQH